MIDNNNFVQSLSNLTQKIIIKPSNLETTSLGVAYLAAIQSNLLKNTQEIEKLATKNIKFIPKIAKKEIIKKISRWKKTIASLIKLNL